MHVSRRFAFPQMAELISQIVAIESILDYARNIRLDSKDIAGGAYVPGNLPTWEGDYPLAGCISISKAQHEAGHTRVSQVDTPHQTALNALLGPTSLLEFADKRTPKLPLRHEAAEGFVVSITACELPH